MHLDSYHYLIDISPKASSQVSKGLGLKFFPTILQSDLLFHPSRERNSNLYVINGRNCEVGTTQIVYGSRVLNMNANDTVSVVVYINGSDTASSASGSGNQWFQGELLLNA